MMGIARRRVFALAFLCVAIAGVLAGGEPAPIRVLFIGNSYTGVNDLPQMIAELAKAARQRPFEFDTETPGSCTLEKHWKDGKAARKIAGGKWDFVVLQEQSMRPLLDPGLMFDYAIRLQGAIAEHGAKTILYQTWARQGEIEKQAELSKAYLDLGKQLKVIVAPVGMAWERALRDDPKLALHSADKSHPSKAGSYLAACVLYSTIYCRSAEGLPGKIGGLGGAEVGKLQAIAWKTVRRLTVIHDGTGSSPNVQTDPHLFFP